MIWTGTFYTKEEKCTTTKGLKVSSPSCTSWYLLPCCSKRGLSSFCILICGSWQQCLGTVHRKQWIRKKAGPIKTRSYCIVWRREQPGPFASYVSSTDLTSAIVIIVVWIHHFTFASIRVDRSKQPGTQRIVSQLHHPSLKKLTIPRISARTRPANDRSIRRHDEYKPMVSFTAPKEHLLTKKCQSTRQKRGSNRARATVVQIERRSTRLKASLEKMMIAVDIMMIAVDNIMMKRKTWVCREVWRDDIKKKNITYLPADLNHGLPLLSVSSDRLDCHPPPRKEHKLQRSVFTRTLSVGLDYSPRAKSALLLPKKAGAPQI